MTTQIVKGIETIEDVLPYESTDDPNTKTHIVNPPSNKHVPGWTPRWDAQDVVDFARMLSVEVVALCGHQFVPKHNPEAHDICMQCMKVAE